jgi:peptide-methionine (R)-S-oxide reductase
MPKMKLSNDEWRKKLTPKQYEILRGKGTEAPFTGKLLYNDKQGSYTCAACGNVLFDSTTKFEADCGWPSFYDAKKGAVEFRDDDTLGMHRVEVTCANCGGHLGHVFDDAPGQPTGQRFCITPPLYSFCRKVNNVV